MWWIAAGVLSILVLAGIYVGYVYYTEWYKIQKLEKQTMFLCDVHGDILPSDVIEFMGQEACPICFHEKLMKSKEGL